METLILVGFMFQVLGIVFRVVMLAISDYPRRPAPVSVGVDAATLILGIAFAFWMGLVLWGVPR